MNSTYVFPRVVDIGTPFLLAVCAAATFFFSIIPRVIAQDTLPVSAEKVVSGLQKELDNPESRHNRVAAAIRNIQAFEGALKANEAEKAEHVYAELKRVEQVLMDSRLSTLRSLCRGYFKSSEERLRKQLCTAWESGPAKALVAAIKEYCVSGHPDRHGLARIKEKFSGDLKPAKDRFTNRFTSNQWEVTGRIDFWMELAEDLSGWNIRSAEMRLEQQAAATGRTRFLTSAEIEEVLSAMNSRKSPVEIILENPIDLNNLAALGVKLKAANAKDTNMSFVRRVEEISEIHRFLKSGNAIEASNKIGSISGHVGNAQLDAAFDRLRLEVLQATFGLVSDPPISPSSDEMASDYVKRALKELVDKGEFEKANEMINHLPGFRNQDDLKWLAIEAILFRGIIAANRAVEVGDNVVALAHFRQALSGAMRSEIGLVDIAKDGLERLLNDNPQLKEREKKMTALLEEVKKLRDEISEIRKGAQ